MRVLIQRHNWGIFFFENEYVETVTVNGDHYRAMLKEFLFTKIEEADIGNIWFQQDYYLWVAVKDKCYADMPRDN